jgi:hypothetical protein
VTDSRTAPYSCQKMRAAVSAAVVLVSAGLLAGCGTSHGQQTTPSVRTPNVGTLRPSPMERHWFGRVGLTLSAPAATGVQKDRREELIWRALQKPGVQVVSLRIYSTPAIAPSLSPALVLAVTRPAYSLRHQLKPVLPLLTENQSAYYLRVVDARAKRVLESYWSPARGAAIHPEGSLYVRPSLLGCSPISVVGFGPVPPCPSK